MSVNENLHLNVICSVLAILNNSAMNIEVLWPLWIYVFIFLINDYEDYYESCGIFIFSCYFSIPFPTEAGPIWIPIHIVSELIVFLQIPIKFVIPSSLHLRHSHSLMLWFDVPFPSNNWDCLLHHVLIGMLACLLWKGLRQFCSCILAFFQASSL